MAFPFIGRLKSGVHHMREHYGALSQPVRASFWYALFNFLQKGVSVLTVPIMTRLMSTQDYGFYSVYQSWYQIVMVFATLNMWNYVMNNGMLKFADDRDGYVSALQGLSTTVTFALLVIYLPFSGIWERFSGLSMHVMLLMFAELFFLPSYEYWCARERFEYRYKGVIAFGVLSVLLVPAISIMFVYFSQDKGLAAVTGRTLTFAFIYAISVIIILSKRKPHYNREYWRFALRFNLPLVPHFLSGIVLNQSDRIMIASLAGEDKAGIYSLAYSLACVTQLANSAILASFIPYTYQSLAKKNFQNVRKNANVLLLLIAALNLILISVAPELIYLFAPEEYMKAVYVIPSVAISGVLMFLFNLFANIEYYFEETRFVMIASVVAALLNIVLNAIFIPRFGFLAAGYTTLVSYIIYSLMHYICMRIVSRRHLNGLHVYSESKIILISISSMIGAFLLLALYPYPVIRYGLILLTMLFVFLNRKRLIKILKTIRMGS